MSSTQRDRVNCEYLVSLRRWILGLAVLHAAQAVAGSPAATANATSPSGPSLATLIPSAAPDL